MILTIVIFIVILLALVLSHEFGHFFSARAFGIKVEEFGFGIPPRVLSLWRDAKGTLYSLNFLPFGGFVKIFGEEDDFGGKPILVRVIVLVSGVGANILLAYFLFTVISGFGVPQAVAEKESGAEITVFDVSPTSPAHNAGIRAGDKIIGFEKIEDFQNFVKENRGQDVAVQLRRGKEEFKIAVLARVNPPVGEGSLGVALGYVRVEKSPWYRAPVDGARLTWQTLQGTVLGFWEIIKNLIKKEPIGAEVAGPVGIFNITSSAVSLGLNTILMLAAILSVNLAVINVLPFPGLDGGRLFFLLIEAVRGRRVSPKVSAWVHSLGLAFLIALMLAITYHDIVNLPG